MKLKPKYNKKAINIGIPEKLHNEFRECVEKEYKNITAKIIELMLKYVKECEDKQ